MGNRTLSGSILECSPSARHRLLLATLLLAAGPATSASAQVELLDNVHRMLPADKDNSRGISVGDLDGDGDFDLYVGNSSDSDWIYLNDGFGTFTRGQELVRQYSDTTQATALGDIDRDGDLDVLVGKVGYYSRDVLLLNDGTGVFTEGASPFFSDLDGTFGLALGDVDRDGDLDSVHATAGPNRLFTNDGSGTLTDATSQLPGDQEDSRAVLLIDVDGDNDLDLVFGEFQTQNRLYLNDGNGNFSDATSWLPADSYRTLALAAGDVDGDGDPDLILGNNFERNRLYLNDGTGTFTDAPNQVPPIIAHTWDVDLGDVDGDGDLDALIGNDQGGPNRLLLNDGAGTFTNVAGHIPDDPDYTGDVLFVDVDSDDDLDAVIGNQFVHTKPQNRLYFNDGAGFFSEVRPLLPVVYEATSGVALGDVDGDEDLDAVFAGYSIVAGFSGSRDNELFLNDGTGEFVDASSQLPGSVDRGAAVALGDVDGDLDLDLLVGNMLSQNRLFLNDGAGVFTDVSYQLPVDSDLTRSIVFGDVDGDGDLDILTGNHSSQNRLYLNDSSGWFTDVPSQMPVDGDETREVALGDVDGDGDLDAFFGNDSHQQNRLYVNDGAGSFTDATSQLPVFADRTQAVALGDVDGDGDLDAVLGNVNKRNRLYLNDGAGVFTDASTQFPPGANFAEAIRLFDIDLDGDLDALIAVYRYQNLLHLNDGAGNFVDATSQLPSDTDHSRGLAVGDLDGDGDIDAVVSNDGQNRVQLNVTRHLTWRGVPRIGKPLTLEICGPPLGDFVLVASRGAGNDPVPPFGTLQLDRMTVVLKQRGSFDANGRAAFTTQIPAHSGLIGAQLFWQALVLPDKRLTRLEVTTLTGL